MEKFNGIVILSMLTNYTKLYIWININSLINSKFH